MREVIMTKCHFMPWMAELVLTNACIDDARPLPSDPEPPGRDAGAERADSAGAKRSSAVAADSDGGIQDPGPWLPLSPDTTYEGRSTAEWMIEWTRWHLSFKDCANTPYFDTTGASCGLDQSDGPVVFFLEGGEYPTRRSECIIPDGRAILVPLTYFIADGLVLRVNQVDQPADKHMLASDIEATMRDFRLQVDDYRVPNPERWLVQPQSFAVTIRPPPNYYTCQSTEEPVEGTVDGYVSGAFALFPPPGLGSHALRYSGTLSDDGFDLVTDVTVNIVVR
jgi:hypothetical protein